jgi:hypothetical protein
LTIAAGGQLLRRQVMVGDEHVDAAGARRLDAGEGRHAVVHRDEQRRRLDAHLGDQSRGQAVAVAHPVGHAEARSREAEAGELAHHQRRAGRAVGVVVAHDHDARAALEVLEQQVHGRLDAIERRHGQQLPEAQVEFRRRGDAARGIHPSQHGMQRRGQVRRRRQRPPHDFTHAHASTSCQGRPRRQTRKR